MLYWRCFIGYKDKTQNKTKQKTGGGGVLILYDNRAVEPHTSRGLGQ